MLIKILAKTSERGPLETLCVIDADTLPNFDGVCFNGENYEVVNKLLVFKRQDDGKLSYYMSYVLEKM